MGSVGLLLLRLFFVSSLYMASFAVGAVLLAVDLCGFVVRFTRVVFPPNAS